MATLEDGGTVSVENGVLLVDHAGAPGVAVDLAYAQSVSYTRAARKDDYGALVVRVDGVDVVAKVQEEDGLKLVAKVRAALPSADEQRFDTDGGASRDE